MDEKKFSIVKHGHSATFLVLLVLNLLTDRIFLKYEKFKALTGADSELGFDPFLVDWKLVNLIVLLVNLAAVAGVLASFRAKETYPKFWFFFALVFLINLIYPSGVWMVEMTGFHFIPLSIIVMNGYGLLAVVLLKRNWGLAKTTNPTLGSDEDGRHSPN